MTSNSSRGAMPNATSSSRTSGLTAISASVRPGKHTLDLEEDAGLGTAEVAA